MLKVPFGKQELWFFNFGLFTNILINDNVDQEVYGNSFKNLDIGLISGIGKAFNINDNNELALELRTNLGLANISDLESQFLGVEKLRTSSLNLMITYIFKNK